MALSSIRRGGCCNVVTLQYEDPLFICSRHTCRITDNAFFPVCGMNCDRECINATFSWIKSLFWASFRVVPLCNQLSSHRCNIGIATLQFSCFVQTAISRSQLKWHRGSCMHTSSQKPSRATWQWAWSLLSQHLRNPGQEFGSARCPQWSNGVLEQQTGSWGKYIVSTAGVISRWQVQKTEEVFPFFFSLLSCFSFCFCFIFVPPPN